MSGNETFITLDDVELDGLRVLIRVDFNVPVRQGAISDDSRIRACLPTISRVLESGGRAILMSHLGRPKEGQYDEKASLSPVAGRLAELLGEPVAFVSDWASAELQGTHRVVLLENVRFQSGETSNDPELSRRMAAMCDVYVNDAFAAAHRKHASTCGVAQYAPVAVAGPLLVRETEALTAAFKNPERPLVGIVGGSKVSTKLDVLMSLLQRVDRLIVGGGIANTFLKAAGTKIGNSLCEDDLLETARKIMRMAHDQGKDIPLPVDVICAKSLDENAAALPRNLDQIEADDLILDIGPVTAGQYAESLLNARTILWNGPLGVFEIEQFGKGTEIVGKAIADSTAYSVAGGGDTLAAISRFNLSDGISYITTAGGAFLEYLEGKTLPAIAILEECARSRTSPRHTSMAN